MTDPKPIVFVVDDDPTVCRSLSALLGIVGLNVRSFTSAGEYLEASEEDPPGCLLLDLQMPEMNGLELMAELHRRGRRPKTIMITAHGDVPQAVAAMKVGVIDFLEKPYRPDELRERVFHVIELDAKDRRAIAGQRDIESRLAQLTTEERQVVEMMISGLNNKDIAEKQEVSLRTFQTRRAKMFEKMQVTCRADLFRKVVQFTEV